MDEELKTKLDMIISSLKTQDTINELLSKQLDILNKKQDCLEKINDLMYASIKCIINIFDKMEKK